MIRVFPSFEHSGHILAECQNVAKTRKELAKTAEKKFSHFVPKNPPACFSLERSRYAL